MTALTTTPTATLSPFKLLLSAAILAGIGFWSWSLYGEDTATRALSFSLLVGATFGVVLQRGRFCFFCNLRDFFDSRDPRGVLSIIVALGVGLLLYHVIFLAWMPIPAPDRLPPSAHIGPTSPVLALAAFVFGVGMAISNSCISAHLYRLGEGSPTAPFALIGAAIGFVLGFLSWNPLYLAVVSNWPTLWLPHVLGYVGTIAVSLAALTLLALLVLAFSRPQSTGAPETPTFRNTIRHILIDRWPATISGIAVGVISMAAYFRVQPLGVTAELGSLARTAASDFRILPDTLFGLDGLRGCATVVKEAIFSNNGVFVIGMVAASFASALPANQFQPSWPDRGHILRGLVGGTLMGWGAMIGLGCTVGVLLSGIHAGALAGWVFLVFCTAGVWLTLIVKRRFA